jgi:hypothetical protein
VVGGVKRIALITVMTWLTGGLSGAVLILFVKIIADRRQRRWLNIIASTNRFALPALRDSAGPDTAGLRIYYKNVPRDDLFLHTTAFTNIGRASIGGLTTVFVLPPSAEILDYWIHSAPVKVDATVLPEVSTAQSIERAFALPVLEAGDTFTIAILAHGPSPTIRCVTRGVEDLRTDRRTHSERIHISMMIVMGLFVLSVSVPSAFQRGDPLSPISPVVWALAACPLLVALGILVSLARR